MKLLEKILVPVELNKPAEEQLEAAMHLAKKFHSRIILLHVLPEQAKLKAINPLIVQYSEKELDKIVEKFSQSDLSAERRIQYGNAFDQILTVSESEDVNLILMASQHDQGDGAFPVDILSEKLVRKSQKPVWLIQPGRKVVPEEIICPVDFSGASERALNNALKIARAFHSRLTILHVFEPLQERFSVRLNIDYAEENRKLEADTKKQLDRFVEKLNFTGVDYSIILLKGKPYEKIIEHARKHQPDLIFMGATGKSLLQRVLLGSVTESVIRELPSSIVITKSQNILNLKIDADISNLEKHLNQAKKLEELGYDMEAVEQLKTGLQINDLHIPTLSALIKLYDKLGEKDLSENYTRKLDEILRRLWDKKIELEIRKSYNLTQ